MSRVYKKPEPKVKRSVSQTPPPAGKNNKRELLIQFFLHFRENGEKNIGMAIEEFVDDFLCDQKELKNKLSVNDAEDSSVKISKQEYEALKRDSDDLNKVSFSM